MESRKLQAGLSPGPVAGILVRLVTAGPGVKYYKKIGLGDLIVLTIKRKVI